MIYSKVTGQGIPVVLLHGYGEDHTLWDNLSSSISSEFKIIAVDLPGFGQSPRIVGSFSIENVAQKVFSHLSEELRLDKFVVMGHSLGGYVTLALANQYPEYVLGLGLINSTALADSPEKQLNRVKTADFIRKHDAAFFLTTFVPNLFFEDNRLQLSEEIEFVIAMGNNLDKNLLADYMLAMKERPNHLQLLADFEHVLFIGGEKDSGFTKEDYDLQISMLRDTSFTQIFANVGHMSMFEAPEELQSISFSFLKSL